MDILLAYASLSGNTRELARMIQGHCEAAGDRVTLLHTDIQTLEGTLGDARRAAGFDLVLLGSWTDNAGRTPSEMKRFIAELVDAVGKPPRVAVFGTGETQWGMEYYCGAVKRIAHYFDSPYPGLEIEQMPHGERNAQVIAEWTHTILGACAGATPKNRTPENTDIEHDRRHIA